jgi:hypothetical protein
MRRIRRHLTFANVTSLLALFLVLSGGTAVALSGTNTVFTDDIADDTVPAGGENPAGGLAAADLRNGSVRSPEVTNNTLRTEDFSKSIPAAHVTGVQQNVPFTGPSETTLAFNEERYDTASMHDNATNNSRLTAPVTGVYAVTAQVSWVPNATGDRQLSLRKNGTTDIAFEDRESDVAQPTQEATTQVRLAAGDYVQVVVAQSTNPQVTLFINNYDETSPEFSMTWLAPGP